MGEARYDIAIIGGGIVGMATALALTEGYPRYKLVILEKEAQLAQHQTGHNSGVIHSGIYYRPGSYKAKLCVEGARLMVEFCQDNGIKHELCGKVIIATEEEELGPLATLLERGTANGVAGLQLLSSDQLKEIEPHARALKGLLSPNTGIVDYAEVVRAMSNTVKTRGAEVMTGAKVERITSRDARVYVDTTIGSIEADYLINCGGLYSDRITEMMGIHSDVRIIPFRGEYYMVRPASRHLVRGLIYPVPDPRFPFLGVHFTKSIHGDIEAGPNAVLAFAREGYRKGDFRLSEAANIIGYPGFWNMARRYWKMGLYEMYRSISISAFTKALQRLVPDIREGDLTPGGAGVRAQAVDKSGNLLDDFKITQTRNAIHVQNAPSPAATASIAIGRYIAALAEENFGLASGS